MVSMIHQKILSEKSNHRVVLKVVCARVSEEYAHIHNAREDDAPEYNGYFVTYR